eukprot:gnl/TRDRNA2_/TRDRNA2_156676_c0_seq1.p1 gnl/TRDRNA2_/TRDRNA2_156676_c0~~gnl/TRDRNA2_/TRDRNA2_156676_c0_seq1.p1  ORF type:complete len:415 (-),score=77.02 gnl/TRDRNA2_/TRDRNA2_156676_c0_seq1:85-1149(-)
MPRVKLRPDGTGDELAVEELKRAWQQQYPIVMEGYMPLDMHGWWNLTGASAAESVLAKELGAEGVDVLRYAFRGQAALEGREQEDHRTRLMQIDSSFMPLIQFLERVHQTAGRPWPSFSLPGEQFMIKRKVFNGFMPMEKSDQYIGLIEKYVREHLPLPNVLWSQVGAAGACSPEPGKSSFTYDDPMLRFQTPFFTFPVHYDCYGNVVVQLHQEKRVVAFPRHAVALVNGRAISHEIYDVPKMIAEGGRELVQTTILRPGDAIFLPIGHFHTVATANKDDGTPGATSVTINYPVVCDAQKAYRKQHSDCERDFAVDFPHRQQEQRLAGDYAPTFRKDLSEEINEGPPRRRAQEL